MRCRGSAGGGRFNWRPARSWWRRGRAGRGGGRVGGGPVGRRELSFDEDWLFRRGDVDGGEQPGLDDAEWRRLDLPHDWGIEDLPYAISDDGAVTAGGSVLTTQVPPTEPAPPPVI